MKPNPIAKTIPFRLARLPILVGLTLTFILAAAFSLTLTDEEADQRLREMGFYVDDPFFPPDLLEAFRELARSMAASEDLFFVSSTESFTYAEGGLKPLEQMSPPSADSLNHGARISYDDAAGLFSFSWWGKADHEYIVEFSRDLMNWDIEPPYVVASDPLPVLNKGVDAPLEIEFESSADRLFLRLQVTSSSAAYEITSLELTEEDWTPFAPGRLLDLRETSYFRIEISPEIPSLQAALPLVSGLVIGEQEVTLNAANTEFENAGGATVLKLTIDPEEWTAGLSAMTIEGPLTKTAFDMGSINENAPSNLTDSDAFMENFNWNFMDQVQSLGRASEHPDDLPLNLDGIRYAGWYTVASHTAGEIYYPFYPYAYRQAKYFYYSGHGSHSTGELLLDDEVRIGANMMKWDDGLSVVILAGCSVLDINDYNDNSNAPFRMETRRCLVKHRSFDFSRLQLERSSRPATDSLRLCLCRSKYY